MKTILNPAFQIKGWAIILSICLLSACHTPTPQKLAVNTLFTLHKTADAVLDGYLDLVVTGKLSTNSVPKVTAAYGQFQSAFNAAVAVVAGNVNALPPQSVADTLAQFTTAVNEAKRGGP